MGSSYDAVIGGEVSIMPQWMHRRVVFVGRLTVERNFILTSKVFIAV